MSIATFVAVWLLLGGGQDTNLYVSGFPITDLVPPIPYIPPTAPFFAADYEWESFVPEIEQSRGSYTLDVMKGDTWSLYDQGWFEGDIILTEEQNNSVSISNVLSSKLWPGGKVYVDIWSLLPKISEVLRTLNTWLYPCVKFVGCSGPSACTSQYYDYIYFSVKETSLCYSYVGRVGGAQSIGLTSGCLNDWRLIMHEIFHAIGLFHEQSREDRDKYVRVLWGNIAEGRSPNFGIAKSSKTYGAPYNAYSIMHYPDSAWRKASNLKTMTWAGEFDDYCKKYYCVPMGTYRDSSLPTDIAKIRKAYGCK